MKDDDLLTSELKRLLARLLTLKIMAFISLVLTLVLMVKVFSA